MSLALFAMPIRLRLASVVLLAVAAACESDEQKTERLRDAAQNDCVAVSAHEIDPKAKTPTDDERNKCETARRDYSAFLDGR